MTFVYAERKRRDEEQASTWQRTLSTVYLLCVPHLSFRISATRRTLTCMCGIIKTKEMKIKLLVNHNIFIVRSVYSFIGRNISFKCTMWFPFVLLLSLRPQAVSSLDVTRWRSFHWAIKNLNTHPIHTFIMNHIARFLWSYQHAMDNSIRNWLKRVKVTPLGFVSLTQPKIFMGKGL